MKSYLELVPISAKIHKRQNRMTMVCIVLAVFLVTAIFSMADMEIRSQKLKAIKDFGNWHIMLKDIAAKDAELISARPDVAASSWYNTINYRLTDAYYLNEKQAVICGAEEAFVTDLLTEAVVEGTFPKTGSQVMLTDNAKKQMNIRTGDHVTLSLPRGDSMDFVVSGFMNTTALASKSDAVVAVVTVPVFESIYKAATEKELTSADLVFYVQFTEKCNIRKAIADIKTNFDLKDENISKNTALLGTMGMSDDSYVMGLYLVAGILFLLVLTAGVLMIAGSLNSNVTQRTQFFGMMRCVGASKKQVVRIVRCEALSWCKTAIPIGMLLAVVLVWVLCAALRFLTPSYFAQMPVFGVSLIGIISGVAVGILTVLIAAQSPAKKASKVSPLAAVSGNATNMQNIKKAVNTRGLRIETALGIHHAKMSRKNFVLMTGSFALSIILFLSFSAVMSFMHHAVKPLSPYAPDVSVIDSNLSNTLSKDFVTELDGRFGIKRIYGRSYKNDIPAEINRQPKTVNLISYEAYQFNWADEGSNVIEGDLLKALGDSSFVFTVFDRSNPLKPGDTVHLNGSEVTVEGVLADSPIYSPGSINLICSEETFQRLTGENGYAVIDIQLNNNATEGDVASIRDAAGNGVKVSDRRVSNREAKGLYWSAELFVYGFLSIIAMITVFNIMNSISMSVAARLGQYRIMRAVGAQSDQIIKMIAAQTLVYAVSGSVAGCVLGLVLHRCLWKLMITAHWGINWQVPLAALAVIVGLVASSCILAVRGPKKRIETMNLAARSADE